MAQFAKYMPAGMVAGMADTMIEDQLAHGRVDNFSAFIDTAFGINLGTKKAQVIKTMFIWLNDAREGQSGVRGYKVRANIATLFTVALATLDGLPADDAAIHADFLTLWAPAPKAKPATAAKPEATKKASEAAAPAGEAPEAGGKSAPATAVPAPGDLVAGVVALIQSGLIGRDSLAALESAIQAYHAARVATPAPEVTA